MTVEQCRRELARIEALTYIVTSPRDKALLRAQANELLRRCAEAVPTRSAAAPASRAG